MSKEEIEKFEQQIKALKNVTSVRGKIYHSFSISGDTIHFRRNEAPNYEKISINELYMFYTSKMDLNTTNARDYISGRVLSPAVAILNALETKSLNIIAPSNLKATKQKVYKEEKQKDEKLFFIAFSELLGENYLKSKSIGKPINKNHIFLSNNFIDYSFTEEVNNAYLSLLSHLNSNFTFTSESISHYVDGLITNHPVLKNRIVEFDEEQHFTSARKDTLEVIREVTNNHYVDSFLTICKDLNYVNNEVLRKHQIKNRLEKLPRDFKDFVVWLQSSNEKESGYIKPKNGFPFLGGRIAQRAYYDSLRDTAHLSPHNKAFAPPIRFSKKTFENKAKTHFRLIPRERLKILIKVELRKTYKLDLKLWM